MFEVEIGSEYIVTDGGTSDGTQVKYYRDNYWYKLDRYGGEAEAEYIATIIERNSNMDESEYVCYEQGLVNGKRACRSRHFLHNKDESFVSLYRLYNNIYGRDIAEVTSSMDLEERVEYVLKFVSDNTNLDIRRYLANTFAIDRIILNEDRHFNNLGLIASKDGFKEAPIFDNGKSLLVGNQSCGRFDSIDEKIKKVIARPFSGSHTWQYDYFKDYCDLQFDKVAILEELHKMEKTAVSETAIYQINKFL